jgi:hypothetical protein
MGNQIRLDDRALLRSIISVFVLGLLAAGATNTNV